VRTEDATGRRFRHAAGHFPTGVTVLSTVVDGQPHGMTVSSFTTVSISPLLVLVSVRRDARVHRHILRSRVFAVTVLGADQEQLARWFANPHRPAGAQAFTGLDWHPAPHTGSPVLAGGISYFDCLVRDAYPAGDHTVLTGHVQAFDVLSERLPLLFVRSRYVPAPAAPQQ
jgi:flavin reductase